MNVLRLARTSIDAVPATRRRGSGLARCTAILLLCAGWAAAQPTPTASIHDPPPPTEQEYRKDIQLPLREALRAAQPDRRAKGILERAVHYQVALLVSQPGERQKNMTKLLSDIKVRNTSEAARAYVLAQIVLRCDQLLNEPQSDVRVAAAHLLNQLNIEWGSVGVPDSPYVPAAEPLLRTLAFDDKFVEVKIVAGTGLGRILKDARPSDLQVLKRFEIAERVAAEIRRLQSVRGQPQAVDAVGHQWCMWSLIGALGNCDRVYNQTREPVFADTLMAVLIDAGEDWHARAKAAYALSRLPYESTSNLAVLNYETARLTRDMANTYNTTVAAGQVWPLWRRAALYIYLTYEARDPAERNRNLGLMFQVKRGGLGTYAGVIQQARGLVLSVTNVLTENPKALPPIPKPALDALTEWLNNNVPADGRLTPESRVRSAQPPAQPMANARSGEANSG